MSEPSRLHGTLVYGEAPDARTVEFIYPEGLHWNCTRCGRCCQDTMDHDRRVLLTEGDVERLSGCVQGEFYRHEPEGGFVGVLHKRDGRCIFLGEEGCMVYEGRALLCRMYPFWVERLGEVFIIKADPGCPGVGEGKELDEQFFRDLLKMALDSMGY